MSTLVANCPRCSAKSITFDALEYNHFENEFDHIDSFDAFCVCRSCKKSSILRLKLTDGRIADLIRQFGVSDPDVNLDELVKAHGYVSIADFATVEPPEHLPSPIEDAFREGAKCLAVGCFSAAGVMFRKCVDLMVTDKHPEVLPKASLKAKIDKLFAEDLIKEGLKNLAHGIRIFGNEGAHNDPLTKADAEDLLNFATELLTDAYTIPKKLELAEERRQARRAPAATP